MQTPKAMSRLAMATVCRASTNPHPSGVFLYVLDLIGLNDDDLGRSSARWEIPARDVT